MTVDIDQFLAVLRPEPVLVSGFVAAVNADVAVVELHGGHQGFLPVTECGSRGLPPLGRRVTAVRRTAEFRPTLSIADPLLPALLLAGVVPEVAAGDVRVMATGRVPGVGTKLAVAATVHGIDPVKVVVGRRGSRINMLQSILGERVSVIHWSADIAELAASAIAPVNVLDVTVHTERIVVTVPAGEIGRAAGLHGTNVAVVSDLLGTAVHLTDGS